MEEIDRIAGDWEHRDAAAPGRGSDEKGVKSRGALRNALVIGRRDMISNCAYSRRLKKEDSAMSCDLEVLKLVADSIRGSIPQLRLEK